MLRVAPTPLVVTYAYVNPLVAVLLGRLVAGETLAPRILIAAPLILVSVGLSHMRQQKKAHVDTPAITVHASTGED
jgi:drug/metabolite transporter (DMT)-like permease